MSLMESVATIVKEAQKTHGFTSVKRIVLEIGRMAGVQQEALRFCFDVVMAGGPAQHAVLEVEEIPGKAWCPACREEVLLDAQLAPCPRCGGMPGKVTQGMEMRVKGLEVD